MEVQAPLDNEACLNPVNLEVKDGDSCSPSSAQDDNSPQQPVKKPTRQWAAWTREEEELFFTALRQVGKNFEKITSRVRSKNKDQVRHYYYRLIRRMNKLLGPELCLDAKNSKDTNAAMLRWWSLLEKYSCKASKLHLKPRRFKIFVESLENQLLKDRRKNVRKRLSPGENCTTPTTVPSQTRTPVNDGRPPRMVLLDSQNIQKVGNGKGASVKRHFNTGISRTNCKIDSSTVKTAKQRPKAGVSMATYKRWEKAAIAGVSLVADAAEHLERTDIEKEVENIQETPANDVFRQVGDMELSSSMQSQNLLTEKNVQNSAKLKLQLFPIDECTRKALESDGHNPHLELTLSTRKKISSIVEHLDRKWGNSKVLSGELMLLPYSAHRGNLVSYQKWTKDSLLCAADVHATTGSSPIFRLRYGWFSEADVKSMKASLPSAQNMNITANKEQNLESWPRPPTCHGSRNPMAPCQGQLVSGEKMISPILSSTCILNETVGSGMVDPNVNTSIIADSTPALAVLRSETGAPAVTRQIENTDDGKMQKNALTAGEWADSLTCVSVGDLLCDSSQNVDGNCFESPLAVGSNFFQQTPFICESFDAAIAAHIYKHQNKVGSQQDVASHAPSIWDAEETCDAFAFQRHSAFYKESCTASRNASQKACEQIARASSPASFKEVEECREAKKPRSDDPSYVDPVDCKGCHTSETSVKDFSELNDLYWPDSLGPLDLDMPSCRYQSEDLILSDSLGGLNRLLASSLDVSQNCSLFGLSRKEPVPTVEARRNSSFADLKISSEV